MLLARFGNEELKAEANSIRDNLLTFTLTSTQPTRTTKIQETFFNYKKYLHKLIHKF